jgi:hypothetical protein
MLELFSRRPAYFVRITTNESDIKGGCENESDSYSYFTCSNA